MIGYNADEINNLINSLNASYRKLGETMAAGWDIVSSTLGTEWVGPDELTFEKELANRMCTLYYSCKDSVEGMIGNVRALGQAWQDFQNANLMKDVAVLNKVSFDLEAVSLPDYQIETFVKPAERLFTSSMRMGVTNGEQSATNINKKVTEYVNKIGETVKAMYDTTSSASAFLGTSLSDAINNYLKKMATSFSQVTTQVSDMQTTLTALVKNYNDQMAAFTQKVSGLDTEPQPAQDKTNITQ